MEEYPQGLVTFASPADAISAAIEGQKRLLAEDWGETGPLLIRMGLNTGESLFREGDYYGSTLHRTARIMSIGLGGQILFSATVYEQLKNLPHATFQIFDMGEHWLKGLKKPEKIYQISNSTMIIT